MATLLSLPPEIIGEIIDLISVYHWHALLPVNKTISSYLEEKIEKLLKEPQSPSHFSLCLLSRHSLIPTWEEIAALVEAGERLQLREVANRWVGNNPKEGEYIGLFTRIWNKDTSEATAILLDHLIGKGDSPLIGKIVKKALYKERDECILVSLIRPCGDITIWEGVKVTPENVMGFLLDQICPNSGFQTGDITGVIRQLTSGARDMALVIIATVLDDYRVNGYPIEPEKEFRSLVKQMQYSHCKKHVEDKLPWLRR